MKIAPLLLLAALLSSSPAAEKPNVLFIAIDDLRDWVGYLHHNEQTKTPNIDRLAKMGTAFTRSYCAAPVCNPSRAALMTGLRPSTTGVYENNNDWRTVIPEDKPLTTAFRNAGYFVCGAGKIYHESYKRRSEWDDYLENEGGGKADEASRPTAKNDGVGGIKFAPLDCDDSDLPDWKITDYGIEQLGKTHDKPFFLAVGLHKPHMPWNVPQKYYDMFPLESIKLPPYLEDDLADVPPAGVKMARPEGDHENMIEIGPLEGSRAGLPRRHRLHGHEHRPPARCLRQIRLQGQHHHRLLVRPRLAPRREGSLAEVRAVGGGDPRAAASGSRRA